MSDREVAVCKLSDLGDGELKEVTVGETPILLARVDGKCSAIGARCTHYGAPLADGALVGNKVICPWHHGCFKAENGDLVEPPALDSLPNYPLRIDGDDIYIKIPEDTSDRRIPPMIRRDTARDDRVFAILGGGAAGYIAAQTLREDGFAGRIVLITRENERPYDRPNLSKDYLAGQAEPEWMPLRPDEFFDEHDIDVVLGKIATNVDLASKTIVFTDGDTLSYDRLLIATGGVPRTLDLPGADLENIYSLRSFESADAIIDAAKGAKHTAIIGASFIGMETAASLAKTGHSVTVIAPDAVPFERTLGPAIGGLFQRIHEKNGVKFRLGSGVVGFGGDGQVQNVEISSGEKIDADLVIVGVGVRPETSFLNGIDLHQDGGVITDKYLSVADDVFAAGDIVHFPDARTGESNRIEHWRTALQQGRVAAHNMAGIPTVYDSVPFFWTTQFDTTLNYVGHAKKWDEIIFRGNVSEDGFLAFYVSDFRVLAAAGVNRDKELAVMEELIRLNQIPPLERLRDETRDMFDGGTNADGLAATEGLL